MTHHDKTPAWFALLHDKSHSLASRLGSLLGGEGAETTNSSFQPTTQWDLLCNDYADVFETPSGVPDHKIKHWTDLIDKNAQPPKPQQYHMSSAELVEVHKQLNEYVEYSWMLPSILPYGSPVLFVYKKEGTLRICIDFKALNKQTKLDAYSLPRIDGILDKQSVARWFSKIDLITAYN